MPGTSEMGPHDHPRFERLEQRLMLSGEHIVSNTYYNLDPGALTNVPVVFSRIGIDGDFVDGITPRIGGQELPAQVDVLRNADDGSIRHALVSFILPSLPGSGSVEIEWLNQAPQAPSNFVWGFSQSGFQLKLELAKTAGGTLVSDVGAILGADWTASAGVDVLYDGPMMKEFEIIDVPKVGGVDDPYIKVFWRLRVFSGESSVRVEAVVENCNPRTNGVASPLHYNFDSVQMIKDGSTVIYSEGAYDHIDQTRYRIIEWTDGQLENIERKPNYNYWALGNFMPDYELTNDTSGQYQNLTPTKVDNIYTAQTAGRNDDVRDQGILEQGIIFDQMPATASRWDIGPYPAWSTSYLLMNDSTPGTYERILHADGNGGGSYYIHVRDDNNAPGYDVLALRSQSPGKVPLSNPHRIDIYQFNYRPDHAHAPSLGYISYMITGAKYYAEEMSFWSSYHLGEWPHIGMNVGTTERAQAWGFRQVLDSAFMLPDGHQLLSYIDGRVDAYAANFVSTYVNSGKAIHWMTEGGNNMSGRNDWVNAKHQSAWMQSWVVWSLGNAVDKGYTQFTSSRDWVAEHIVKLYTSNDTWQGPDGEWYSYNPKDAMSYSSATSVWT